MGGEIASGYFHHLRGVCREDDGRGEAGGDKTEGTGGKRGADKIDGGLGTDRADYRHSKEGVIVDLLKGAGFSGDAKDDVQCKIEMDSIDIAQGNTTILAGKFFQNVLPKESNWEMMGDGKLGITLKKMSHMRWLMVLR